MTAVPTAPAQRATSSACTPKTTRSPRQQQPPPAHTVSPPTPRSHLPHHQRRLHLHQEANGVDHHFLLRKQMIVHLQRLHPLLATDTTMHHHGQATRIPELVQRLELMLYKAAKSLDEYVNVCTLERRVHSLVTLLEPLPAPPHAQPERMQSSSKKRQLPSQQQLLSKRIRRSITTSSPASSTTTSTHSTSLLLSQLNGDLFCHVFAFVDGIDTLQSVAHVNKFFFCQARHLVFCLSIDVANATHSALLQHRMALVLASCSGNLTTLKITNSNNKNKKNGFSRGDTNTPHWTAHALLYELRDALATSSQVVLLPRLHTLELCAPFDGANETDSLLVFLHALATNLSLPEANGERVTQPPGGAFQRLVLDTTIIGDRRVPKLCALFQQFPGIFQQNLRVLELRNNFIGETGLKELCKTLSMGWQKLQVLGLARNILTDNDAFQVAPLLGNAFVLPALECLDLSENFVGKPGMEALARAAAMQARQFHVETASNCMETQEAAQLFR